MIISLCVLREKDVINVCDGKRLGFITDAEIDSDSGRICAVYVSERFFCLSGSNKNCLKIEWCNIRCIGEDTVLVDASSYPRIRDDCEYKFDRKRPKRIFDIF